MIALPNSIFLFICLRDAVTTEVLPVAAAGTTERRSAHGHECIEEQISLLQVDTVHADAAHRHVTAHAPVAGWFGNFDQGESTYTYGGEFANRNENPLINVRDGWNPSSQDPFPVGNVREEWFHETPSGGRNEAWQTFYPANNGQVSAASNDILGASQWFNGAKWQEQGGTGEWFTGTGGKWQQEYKGYQPPDLLGEAPLTAGWFDSSIEQLDGFGREDYPDFDSPRRFLTWQEKSSNTSLSCNKPGCTANVSLLAPFDYSKENARSCKLSVFFHPTDFDNKFAGERVDWVQVNNRMVSHKCHPRLDGCNATAQRPLVPCVYNIPLDLVMPLNGLLTVAAKINEVVDECPFKGNYLSAVPVVTCLVTPKGAVLSNPPHSKSATKVKNGVCRTEVPLGCKTKGCSADVVVPISSSCAKLGKCTLSVNVTQTDYDGADGTKEDLEYIKVNGVAASGSQLKPGKNPCKSEWQGKPLTEAQKIFTALKDFELKNVTGGHTTVSVAAKISDFVDECPSKNGNLLDAHAVVICSATGKALLQEDAAVRVGHHQLRGLGV
jgi:hypothetical protein